MTALSGATESSLRVATFAGGSWQLLPGAVVDTQAKTVSGVTTHLSPYAIVTEMVGKTCATVQTAFGCAATGAPTAGGGPSSGGTAPPNTGAGATGGSSSTCDPPTCAGATNVCAQYPGAAMDSCVDSSTGYSAACCFPSNAPICFAIAGAGGACAGGTGRTAVGRPVRPLRPATRRRPRWRAPAIRARRSRTARTARPGFTGACCFAPQAPVCVKTGAGRACAGSTGGGTTCPPPPRCADGNPCAEFRRREGELVHRHGRRVRGDLLLRRRDAPDRERRRHRHRPVGRRRRRRARDGRRNGRRHGRRRPTGPTAAARARPPARAARAPAPARAARPAAARARRATRARRGPSAILALRRAPAWFACAARTGT